MVGGRGEEIEQVLSTIQAWLFDVLKTLLHSPLPTEKFMHNLEKCGLDPLFPCINVHTSEVI